MWNRIWVRLAALTLSAMFTTASANCFGEGGGSVQGDLDDGGVVIID